MNGILGGYCIGFSRVHGFGGGVGFVFRCLEVLVLGALCVLLGIGGLGARSCVLWICVLLP